MKNSKNFNKTSLIFCEKLQGKFYFMEYRLGIFNVKLKFNNF